MKKYLYYILTGMVFLVNHVAFQIYFNDMITYVRFKEASSLKTILIFLFPAVIFILLIIISLKAGKKSVPDWNINKRMIMILIIIAIQLIPVPDAVFEILPNNIFTNSVK